MAGLIATRPGLRTRLFFRLHVYHGRKNESKGLAASISRGFTSAMAECGR